MDHQKTNLILFGITGDLSQNKLIPSLVKLNKDKLLPKNFNLMGIGRRNLTDEELQKIKQIDNGFVYLQQDINEENLYQKIEHETKDSNRLFYLATFPNLYPTILNNFKNHKVIKSSDKILIEKPIGDDFKSAQKLISEINSIFRNEQTFFIDHYLGKETVQNILAFRFSNFVFEHLINSQFVDHIQITFAEGSGMGSRGRFYDHVGALKDVGQNHLLQLLAFVTLDEPNDFTSHDIHLQRLKLLKSIKIKSNSLILGQYEGYKTEKDIDPSSQTDTYFAFEVSINSKRFKGVPIYLRGGKKLQESLTEVSIVFKKPTGSTFHHLHQNIIFPNILIYRIQPNEGIVLKVLTKKMGHELSLEETFMEYSFKDSNQKMPDAYEKLIMDAINSDQTFFPKGEEILEQWKVIDKLLEGKSDVKTYESGSWGPKTDYPFMESSEIKR